MEEISSEDLRLSTRLSRLLELDVWVAYARRRVWAEPARRIAGRRTRRTPADCRKARATTFMREVLQNSEHIADTRRTKTHLMASQGLQNGRGCKVSPKTPSDVFGFVGKSIAGIASTFVVSPSPCLIPSPCPTKSKSSLKCPNNSFAKEIRWATRPVQYISQRLTIFPSSLHVAQNLHRRVSRLE